MIETVQVAKWQIAQWIRHTNVPEHQRNSFLSFYSLLCYCFIVDFVRKMKKQERITTKLETAKLTPTTVKYDLISTRICHCPLILNMSSLPLPKIETLVVAVHQYRRMLLYTRCAIDQSQSLVFFSQAHILNAVPLLNEFRPFIQRTQKRRCEIHIWRKFFLNIFYGYMVCRLTTHGIAAEMAPLRLQPLTKFCFQKIVSPFQETGSKELSVYVCFFVASVINTFCPLLSSPTNGIMVLTKGQKLFSRANFSCSTGYEINGSQQRFCLRSRSWTGTDTTCSRKHPLKSFTNRV